MMANISMADTLILMVLALVVFGPRRLPLIGRQIGKLMYEFRKASNDFKFQMEEELRQAEEADRRKKQEEERQRALAAAPPAPQIEASTASPAQSPVDSGQPETAAQPEMLGQPETPASAAAENPYAGSTYPAIASEAGDGATSEEPTPSAPAGPARAMVSEESPTPRILPPSTGEKIAADRPGAQPQQRELFATRSPDNNEEAQSAAPDAERSEPAAHHG